ncbi:hypothetical protein LTR84_011378 [Exophiala bonariae]|uniref:Uncharacterized protein n=1 Tax=Exophiala bonariae TaxID=1690606 RepID=A0AAV9MRY6_9EURO|nr:hypothetical protein LTR84_011378 [Exophiala bonariae]
MTYIYAEDTTCIQVAAGTTGPDDHSSDYCSCCESARNPSSVINTCPGSDLSILDFPKVVSNSIQSGPRALGFNCSPILNSDMCTLTFGLDLWAGTEFYDLAAPPPNVTMDKPLSDIGTLTAFPGAQTYPLTISNAGYTSTITMAPFNAKNAAAATQTMASGATGGAQEPGSHGSAKAACCSKEAMYLIGLIFGLMSFSFTF